MTTSSSKVLPAAAAPDEGAVFDADEPELAMLRAEIERLERVAAGASTRGVTKDGLQQGGRAAASADSDPSAAEARAANAPAAELSGADAECKEPGPSGQADSSNAPRVPRIQSSRMFELLQLDADGKPLEWDSHEHRKVGMPPAAMDSTKTGTTRVATTAAPRPSAQTRYAHPRRPRSFEDPPARAQRPVPARAPRAPILCLGTCSYVSASFNDDQRVTSCQTLQHRVCRGQKKKTTGPGAAYPDF